MNTHAKMIAMLGLISSLSACGGGYGGGGGGGGGTMTTVSFTSPASAITINLGQSVKLSWTSSSASGCTASSSAASAGNFNGSVAAAASAVVAPTAAGTYTYKLSCASTAAYGTAASATSAMLTVNPSILSSLATIVTIGSTLDPIENGGNPYGLAIAPVSAGLISAGDLVVCNFNDGATGTQGLGTTIIGLHPSAGAAPYRIAQSSSLQGCAALAVLPDDSIAASAFSANLVPLVSPAGVVSNPFAAQTFAGPWSQAYAAAFGGHSPALYVSSQLNGSIGRISLSGDTQTGYMEIAKGFCGSGTPGAVFAPAGLTYDPAIDALYIVDTSSNSVVALSSVSTIATDGIIVNGSCGNVHPTPALTFSGTAAGLAKVIASGSGLNAPISAALLSDGNLVVSNGDINGPPVTNLLFEVSPAIGIVGAPLQLDKGAAGALFGLAATVDGSGNQIIYFNDDNDNTVKKLSK